MSRPIATSAGRLSTGVANSFLTPVNNIPNSLYQVQDGRFTQTIYTLIKDKKHTDVIRLLTHELHSWPKSRAALSLLGYCYFQVQDFNQAAKTYETLAGLFPNVSEYHLYHAQSLYKACQYEAAAAACLLVTSPEFTQQTLKLQAAIRFQLQDISGCRLLVEKSAPQDPDTFINKGCLLFKEGKFDEALGKFNEALKISGYRAELLYYIALCHYVKKQFVNSLKALSEIIERGIKNYPELNVGTGADDLELRKISNSQVLHESCLLEAFNLKAAIEYQLKNFDGAAEALLDMPPRAESDLDPVTLHNTAVVHMDTNPSSGFEKLNFLLSLNPCPPETLSNLLLLYTKQGFYDMASDLLSEFSAQAQTLLDPFTKEFVEAILLKETAPDESYRRLESVSLSIIEKLRYLTKQVQNARQTRDDEAIKNAIAEYDVNIEKYVSVVMQQAKIYWDQDQFATVEKLFKKSMEFANDHDVWKLNVAHVMFMQGNRYKDAVSFYEPIVQKHQDKILEVPAIVLANLCVSYIMTSQNELAEDIMRHIEREEEIMLNSNPKKQAIHLCIVNLVIGTLYCSKGNNEFGISRVIKSLDPIGKKLSPETWYYAKRCFVSLYDILAKHMLLLKDSCFSDILSFFDLCEANGKHISASFVGSNVSAEFTTNEDKFTNNVSSEARRLKAMYLRLYQ